MDILFQGYSALRGDKGAPQSGVETVDKLCDRVAHSTLLEDRRASVLGLKGLARDWKLNTLGLAKLMTQPLGRPQDVGTKGMPVLINVLKNDRMDVEIIKATLETLNILCTSDDKEKGKQGGKDVNNLGIMFTEIYVKDPANVTLLLDVLEEVDFYVRFDTVELLTTLLKNAGNRLQDCILTSPLGLSRLIDLLDDRREIIRNEGLLLLIALTESNADIQKIIAFENAFERLLAIILEEGATDGGIIVQDCLQLTHNLLKYNVSNQNLFRETRCIQRIPTLLTTRAVTPDKPTAFDVPLTHETTVWTEQKSVNACLVLELIRILVGPKNPNTVVNQTVMHQANIIPTLIDAALSNSIPSKVKVQALYALADIIRGHKANQDLVSKTTVPLSGPNRESSPNGKAPNGASPPEPALFALLRMAVDKHDFPVRAAATYAFECYLYNNPDAQLAFVSTLTPPPSDNPNNQRSGGIVELPDVGSTIEAVSLLHKCMFALVYAHREGADVRVQIGLLCLLATWLYESTEAVKEFLTEGSNVQFLVEQINQSSGLNPLVQGLAAYLLGLVYEYNDDSEPTFTRRVGADVYVSRIERLRESKEFNSTHLQVVKKDLGTDANGYPELYFDHTFVELLKSTHDHIARSITTVNSKGSPTRKNKVVEEAQEKSAIQSYKDLIAAQEKEIETLRQKLEDLQAQLAHESASSASQIDSLNLTIQNLHATVQEQSAQYTQLEKEQEDLLVLLADQDMDMKKLRGRLRAYGEVFDEEEDEDEDGEAEDDEKVTNGVANGGYAFS
ncbi:Vesicle-mediated ER to Golgi transport protein [Borealophlyctis nickersoniae]|nr:Vesicle-mediated ER to Golgi transport protein [Borealophlyctis nickersoniae]